MNKSALASLVATEASLTKEAADRTVNVVFAVIAGHDPPLHPQRRTHRSLTPSHAHRQIAFWDKQGVIDTLLEHGNKRREARFITAQAPLN